MTIRRAPRPESEFLVLSNQTIRDPRLSYRARGVLATILSFPDDWETTIEGLAADGREGKAAVRTAMNELIEAGYAKRTKYQDGLGQWRTRTDVRDTIPQPDVRFPEAGNRSRRAETDMSVSGVQTKNHHKEPPTSSSSRTTHAPPGVAAALVRGAAKRDRIELALDVWESVTRRRLTRTQRARMVAPVAEFLDVADMTPDQDEFRRFLEWAHEDGCRAPGGWAWWLTEYGKQPETRELGDCTTCGNRRWLAVLPDGSRVAIDDSAAVDSTTNVMCECHPGRGGDE